MSPLKLLLWALLGAQTLAVGAEAAQSDNTVSMDSTLPGNGKRTPVTELSSLEQLGRQLYLNGTLANGNPLVGKRANGIKLTGVQAACVQCHRRSGLGGVEGHEVILPITGHALFGGGDPVIVKVDKRFNQGVSTPSKQLYDDKSFAAAVKQGQHVSGRKLSALMPQYDLSNEQLQAVAAYLRTLSVTWSPGAGAKEIHLATVIAPGVSPARRKVFVDTLNAILNQHNVNAVSKGRRNMSSVERRVNSRRALALDIWELSGPSSTWGAQLEQRQQQTPVFAIVSGLAQDEWQPVQDFCEQSKVACWFPSVDLVPQGADKSAYSLYFSGGVQLEAAVIAQRLLTEKTKPEKVVQVVGPNPTARGAAQAAQALLAKAGITVQDIEWNPSSAATLAESINSLEAHDALLVWLQTSELKDVVTGVSVPKSAVFLSSTLVGEATPAWPTEWGKNAWLVQRLDMPEMRAANLTRFKDWIKYRQLPMVDEKMQSEVYFAVNSFSWMMSSMLNNLYTDYLIDRAEATLSMREAMQVQEEVQAMMMGGGGRRPQTIQNAVDPATAPAHSADIPFLMKREGTTVYPRLSLGIGQRFASKGAYIQKIATDASHADDSNAKWIVP